MVEDLKDVYNDYFEDRFTDEELNKVAGGDRSFFHNRMRSLTLEDQIKKNQASDRAVGRIDRYATVRHATNVLFPHAQQRALEKRLEAKGGKKESFVVKVGLRRVSGRKNRVRTIYIRDKESRKSVWGLTRKVFRKKRNK